MKIVTYLLGALLAAALGAAALFYFTTFQPLSLDYARMKAGMPELDKAKAELKKFKDQEAQQTKDTAWINPAAQLFTAGLASELKDGKAEVAQTANALVVNVAEDLLYTPGSKTFAKDTGMRLKLTALLKKDELKGRDIFIGNSTETAPAQGKGKKKIPGKDALSLASERSAELVKALVKEGFAQEALAAIAYSVKPIDRGFKLKNRKTVIIIGACPGPALPQTPPAAAQQPTAPAAKPSSGAAQPAQPRTIPIKPAQPKTN
jgi:hypothetical protein